LNSIIFITQYITISIRRRVRSIVMSRFCLSVTKLRQTFCAYSLRSWLILLWRRYDTLCTSGFVDDVMFIYNGLICRPILNQRERERE